MVESTDGGKTFSPPRSLTTFIPYEYADQLVSGGDVPGHCGDGPDACVSQGFAQRHAASVIGRSGGTRRMSGCTSVYEATVPGSGRVDRDDVGLIQDSIGRGGQGAVYYTRYDGASRKLTTPARIDPETVGHQFFPDISVSNSVLHAIWWDSHNTTDYSIARPIRQRRFRQHPPQPRCLRLDEARLRRFLGRCHEAFRHDDESGL